MAIIANIPYLHWLIQAVKPMCALVKYCICEYQKTIRTNQLLLANKGPSPWVRYEAQMKELDD